MVRIRLSRVGRKNAPKYRITVADSRKHVTKKFLEVVGFYNPSPKGKDPKVKLKMDRIEAWIKNGAQPTDRVKHLMKLYQQQEKSG